MASTSDFVAPPPHRPGEPGAIQLLGLLHRTQNELFAELDALHRRVAADPNPRPTRRGPNPLPRQT